VNRLHGVLNVALPLEDICLAVSIPLVPNVTIPPMASTWSVAQRIYDARDYVVSWTWAPSVRIARAASLAILYRIEYGQLQIIESDGNVVVCGNRRGDSSPVVVLRVLNDIFWVRLMLSADMVRLVRSERYSSNPARDLRRATCLAR
jgi:hypothetical protein